MKKGDTIQVNSNIDKSYTRVNGFTEEIKGYKILKKGTILFHVSANEKLTEFASINTCFTFSKEQLALTQGYVYMFKLKEDVKVQLVDDDEIRFTPNNDNVSIIYLGTIIQSNKVIKDKYNRIIKVLDRFSFHKDYKELEKSFQNFYNEEFHKSLNDKYNIEVKGYHLSER